MPTRPTTAAAGLAAYFALSASDYVWTFLAAAREAAPILVPPATASGFADASAAATSGGGGDAGALLLLLAAYAIRHTGAYYFMSRWFVEWDRPLFE